MRKEPIDDSAKIRHRPRLVAPPSMTSKSWLYCLGLCLAVLVVFGQTAAHELVWDDDLYLVENPRVLRGLSIDGIIWAFTHSYASNWHPLTTISQMLDCQFYGLHPAGHHLTNVALHAATTVALFLSLRLLTGAEQRSALAAAVFAIHPLRVESVAFVAERKDVLSGLFFALSLGAYAFYVSQRSWRRYLVLMALFACALLSKPMAVTTPCVILLLDYWPLARWRGAVLPQSPESGASLNDERHNWGWLVWEKLPLFALAAALCVATLMAQSAAISRMAHLSLTTRVMNAIVAYFTYLCEFFAPVGLTPFYPHPGANPPLHRLALSLLALVAISLATFLSRRRSPYLVVGWLWFLGMLVPVIGLLQVGGQALADRYTYLPQIGLCLAVVWGAADLARKISLSRRAQIAFVGAALGLLMMIAWRQTSYWRNSLTLWTRALDCDPSNWMAHGNLSAALRQQGRIDEAIVHMQAALENSPAPAEAHYQLGCLYEQQGRLDAAIEQYSSALRFDPSHASALNNLGHADEIRGHVEDSIRRYRQALQAEPQHVPALINLGLALSRQGRFPDAIAQFQQALAGEPPAVLAVSALNNLGLALEATGRLDEAAQHYQQAIALEPQNATAHYNLGNYWANKQRAEEAVAEYRLALAAAPVFAEAAINLANLLATRGENREAIQWCQRALEIEPRSASAHANLGQALLNERRLDEAAAQFRAALTIEPRWGAPAIGLIDVLLAQGQVDAALTELARALAIAEADQNAPLANLLRDRRNQCQAQGKSK